MTTKRQHIKIILIEDNEFYNNIFAEKLRFYLDHLMKDWAFTYQLDTYTEANRGIASLHYDTDLVFLDFYLDNNQTALQMMDKIKERCPLSEVVVLSQHVFFTTKLLSLLQGAKACYSKEESTFFKSCTITERLIKNRLNANH